MINHFDEKRKKYYFYKNVELSTNKIIDIFFQYDFIRDRIR